MMSVKRALQTESRLAERVRREEEAVAASHFQAGMPNKFGHCV
jgi:hypothetical protein